MTVIPQPTGVTRAPGPRPGTTIVAWPATRFAQGFYTLGGDQLRVAWADVPLDGSGDEAGADHVRRQVADAGGTLVAPASGLSEARLAQAAAITDDGIVVTACPPRRAVEVLLFSITVHPDEEPARQYGSTSVPLDGSGDEAGVDQVLRYYGYPGGLHT